MPLEGVAPDEWVVFERVLIVRDVFTGGQRSFATTEDAHAFRAAVYAHYGAPTSARRRPSWFDRALGGPWPLLLLPLLPRPCGALVASCASIPPALTHAPPPTHASPCAPKRPRRFRPRQACRRRGRARPCLGRSRSSASARTGASPTRRRCSSCSAATGACGAPCVSSFCLAVCCCCQGVCVLALFCALRRRRRCCGVVCGCASPPLAYPPSHPPPQPTLWPTHQPLAPQTQRRRIRCDLEPPGAAGHDAGHRPLRQRAHVQPRQRAAAAAGVGGARVHPGASACAVRAVCAAGGCAVCAVCCCVCCVGGRGGVLAVLEFIVVRRGGGGAVRAVPAGSPLPLVFAAFLWARVPRLLFSPLRARKL